MNIFDIVIVQPIFNLLVAIYSIVPGADFGVSLIIVTVLIRFAMWPLVKKQLHQTKAMRKLQPELQKIKKQTKDNRQQQGMQMMELYKQHNVSPFRSIGILLLQLPIFIALYRVIRIFTLHRDQIEQFTYGFLQQIPVVEQLIKSPETFKEQLFGFIDLTGNAISADGINIIIVILAAGAAFTQYFLSKQTMPQAEGGKKLRELLAEAGEGNQPDQSEMNAIMTRNMIKFLPFMMFFIMVNLPAALALYYAVSNMVAFIQQRHILKQDEGELAEIASEPVKKAKNAKTAKIVKPAPAGKAPVKTTPVKKTQSKPAATTTTKPTTKKPTRDKMKTGTNITRISAKDSRSSKR